MLSLTGDELPNFTYASPEDVRGAQQKALNLWVGATSPLWAPFWLASAVGVGLWSLSQGFRQFEALRPMTTAVPSPVDRAPATATDVAATVQTMVDDGVIAPMQAAGKAIQDMTTAVTPSPQAISDQMKTAGDDVVAEATEIAQTATSTVDKATTRAVEQAEAQVDVQADAVADIANDTGSLLPPAGAAAAVAADTAVAAADGDRPQLRKPGTKKS